MAQLTQTLACLAALPFFFAATSFAQSSDLVHDGTGIPVGHKVIAMRFPSDSMEGRVQKGDHVNVFPSAVNSKAVATNIRIFADPMRLKDGDTGRCTVALLAPSKVADQILRAYDADGIRLVSPETSKAVATIRRDAGALDANARHQSDQTAKMRLLASRLDEIAADLESLERYSRADELREHAQKLRVDVRSEK